MSELLRGLDIVVHLDLAADAQRHMAANASEDRAHWHHVYLADVMETASKTIKELRGET